MSEYPYDNDEPEHFGHRVLRKAASMRRAASIMFPLLLIESDNSVGMMQMPLSIEPTTWPEQIANAVDAHTIALGAVLYADENCTVWCYACQSDDDNGATRLNLSDAGDPHFRNVLNGYAALMRNLLIAHLPKPTQEATPDG